MVEEETATHEKQLEDFDAKKASHEGTLWIISLWLYFEFKSGDSLAGAKFFPSPLILDYFSALC